jgi:hypothetical protein
MWLIDYLVNLIRQMPSEVVAILIGRTAAMDPFGKVRFSLRRLLAEIAITIMLYFIVVGVVAILSVNSEKAAVAIAVCLAYLGPKIIEDLWAIFKTRLSLKIGG